MDRPNEQNNVKFNVNAYFGIRKTLEYTRRILIKVSENQQKEATKENLFLKILI